MGSDGGSGGCSSADSSNLSDSSWLSESSDLSDSSSGWFLELWHLLHAALGQDSDDSDVDSVVPLVVFDHVG